MTFLVLMLSGCFDDAVTPPPEPPATIERLSRLPWGDRSAAAVNRLAGHIHDQMRAEYGRVRETYYVARDPAEVAALQGWYRLGLGEAWLPRPLSPLPEENSFAFTAGRHALAVGWLSQLPDGRVPVVVMRYGDRRNP